MPMIHTPLDSPVCTEPTAGLADCARARPAPGAAEGAERAGDVAERMAVEALLGRSDLLRLEDVELDDVLRRLELAHAEELARRLRIAQVVRQLEFLEQRPEVRALEHLEIRRGELELAEIGDVVGREPLQKRRVVALDFARNDDERRSFLAGVHVFDGLVQRLVGRLVGALRRVAARVGDGLPNVGCAPAGMAMTASAASNAGAAQRERKRACMWKAPLSIRCPDAGPRHLRPALRQ
jgi:hypothetical protein